MGVRDDLGSPWLSSLFLWSFCFFSPFLRCSLGCFPDFFAFLALWEVIYGHEGYFGIYRVFHRLFFDRSLFLSVFMVFFKLFSRSFCIFKFFGDHLSVWGILWNLAGFLLSFLRLVFSFWPFFRGFSAFSLKLENTIG